MKGAGGGGGVDGNGDGSKIMHTDNSGPDTSSAAAAAASSPPSPQHLRPHNHSHDGGDRDDSNRCKGGRNDEKIESPAALRLPDMTSLHMRGADDESDFGMDKKSKSAPPSQNVEAVSTSERATITTTTSGIATTRIKETTTVTRSMRVTKVIDNDENHGERSAFVPEEMTAQRTSQQEQHQQQHTLESVQSPPRIRSTELKKNTQENNRSSPTGTGATIPVVGSSSTSPASELHAQNTMRYYQIAYRGVVSLLSEPDERSDRSGVYVSYGEVVATSGEEIKVVTGSGVGGQNVVTAIVIRVDKILTGGYAIDANRTCTDVLPPTISGSEQHYESRPVEFSKVGKSTGRDTPRRSNVTEIVSDGASHDNAQGDDDSPSVIGSTYSALTMSDYVSFGTRSPTRSPMRKGKGGYYADGERCRTDSDDGETGHGYLFLSRPSITSPIAIGLSAPPSLCQSGPFLYKVVSSTPLPIIAGPAKDAPRNGEAVVLPGTVHQIGLRIRNQSAADNNSNTDTNAVTYLRLSHRRGWLADRRVGDGRHSSCIVLTEVLGVGNQLHHQSDLSSDDQSVSLGSVSSYLTNSLSSVSTASRRRRRPPLRKRKQKILVAAVAQDNAPRTESGAAVSSPIAKNETFDYGFDYDGVGTFSFEQNSAHPLSPKTPARGINPASIASPASALSNEEHMALRHSLSANSSLLDHSASFSVPNIMSQSMEHSMNPWPVEPTFFLMKVTAPNGLKILDAPQFQVNNLIRGQGHNHSSVLYHNKGTRAEGGFRTMGGAFSNDPSIIRTDSTDSSARTRILPRGKLFEASKRLEVSGLAYAPGAGLIKLADNSGWAIIPNREELNAQYRAFRGGKAGVQEGEATQAFKEVGNAITVFPQMPQKQQQQQPSVWLRVIHRGGVLVSCPPPPELSDVDIPPSASASSPHSSAAGAVLCDGNLDASSDVGAASIASSFLDAMFRTPRKSSYTAVAGAQLNDSGIASESSKGRSSRGVQKTDYIIPCGYCVEVEPWQEDSSSQPRPNFARLCGGQGWIPRHLNGQVFVRVVDPPDERKGSIWFRVKSKRGIKVRYGPSRMSNSIKSSDGGEYFRFECGEFLRASEILTMKNLEVAKDVAASEDGQYRSFECFAKLYRNSQIDSRDTEGKNFRRLANLTAAGEWVQVYGSGRLYLEECADPPRIERHRQCWRYSAVNDSGIHVRKGPSYLSEMTGKILRAGDTILVNERVTAHGEIGAWLRLKDGTGWVHDKGEGGESVMIVQTLRQRTAGRSTQFGTNEDRHANEAAYNTIIARLFHEYDEDGQKLESMRRQR